MNGDSPGGGEKPRAGRTRRRLAGQPVQVGQRTVQPVARLTARYGGRSGPQGTGAGLAVRLAPEAALVREPDGRELSILIPSGPRCWPPWRLLAQRAGGETVEGGEAMDEQFTGATKPIEQLLERLDVNRVFGQPAREGEVTIIPVAEISASLGYGFGSGPSGEQSATGKSAGPASAGAGGGAMGRAKPRGYLRIAPDGVTYEPLQDPNRTYLAELALGGWVVYLITRTIQAFARRRG